MTGDKLKLQNSRKLELLVGDALCWSSREEIPHIQGKRNPSKMVDVVRASEGRHTETIITEN